MRKLTDSPRRLSGYNLPELTGQITKYLPGLTGKIAKYLPGLTGWK